MITGKFKAYHNLWSKRIKPLRVSLFMIMAISMVQGMETEGEKFISSKEFGTSDVKSSVLKYIPQIFNLTKQEAEIYDTKEDGCGLGFIVDPKNNIIFTTETLSSTKSASVISHERPDGSQWTSIEILGSSPNPTFGNFGFLRFQDSLISLHQDDFHHFLSLEMEFTPPLPKSIISYFRYVNDDLKMETGEIINAYSSVASGMWQEHCYSASYKEHTPNFGSPVFNEFGRVLGLISQRDTETKRLHITPIWYPFQGYQQLLSGKRISYPALSLELSPINMTERAQYISVPFCEIKGHTMDEDGQKNMLLGRFFSFSALQDRADRLMVGDIILTVNGEKIGINKIKLTSLLKNDEPARVEIYRDHLKLMLTIQPMRIFQTFGKIIDVAGVKVMKSGPLNSWIYGQRLDFPSITTDELAFIVRSVNDQSTATFDEFVQVLYDIVERQKLDYFYIRGQVRGKVTEEYLPMDISQWRGRTFYMMCFDEARHTWQKLDYKDYVKTLQMSKSEEST